MFSDSHACLCRSISYIYFHFKPPPPSFHLFSFHSLYLYTFTIQTFFIRFLYFDSSFAIGFACIFIEPTTLFFYQDLLFPCSSLGLTSSSFYSLFVFLFIPDLVGFSIFVLFYQDIWPLCCLDSFGSRTRFFSGNSEYPFLGLSTAGNWEAFASEI